MGRDPGPGQAVLYGTTNLLLERLGLDAISQLPPLAQFVPGPEIMDALERSLRADRPASSAASAQQAMDDEDEDGFTDDDVEGADRGTGHPGGSDASPFQ